MTSDEAVNALAAKIDRLNVVIHCAGKLIRWEEHKPAVFRQIDDIHLFGNVRLAAAFRPHLKASRGCLINIASMFSYFGAAHVPERCGQLQLFRTAPSVPRRSRSRANSPSAIALPSRRANCCASGWRPSSPPRSAPGGRLYGW